MATNQLGGPIPGENFTSDTKNYPWHRPPEHTDMDKAIEDIGKKLMSEESSVGILTMVENGISVVQLTDMFLTSGIGNGKWTPDMALLLAGPTAHIIKLMCDSYGVECNLGIDKVGFKGPTKSFFDGVKAVEKEKAKSAMAGVDLEEVKEQSTGFMGMAAPKTAGPEKEY